MTYSGAGRPHLIQGNFPTAISWLTRSAEICRRANFAPLYFLVACDLGQAYALSGRAAEGVALLEETAGQSADMRLMPTHAWNVTMLAEAYLLAGRRDDAARDVQRGLAMARAHKQRWLEAEGLRILGEILASAEHPDPAAARSDFEEAARIARDLSLRPLLGRCLLASGRLARRAGDGAAREHLSQAAALFSETGMRFWLEQAQAELRALDGASKP